MKCVYRPVAAKVSIMKISKARLVELLILISNDLKQGCSSLQNLMIQSCLIEIVNKILNKKIENGKTGTLTLTRTQALCLCIYAEDKNKSSTAFQISMLIKQQVIQHHYDILRKS